MTAGSTAISTNSFARAVRDFPTTDKMPVLFVGHGNPMNAILKNEFNQSWKKLGEQLPKPKAILVISAHWETNGTRVTAMKNPRTIHDFGGFPKELFAQQYPAPGSPELASELTEKVKKTAVSLDGQWGLDHGTWSVLLPMYPKADIPVFQLSIDRRQAEKWHYELAAELRYMRKKGVLIIGSGNVVHNLGMINWNSSEPFDWARDFNEKIKSNIQEGDFQKILGHRSWGKMSELAVPTNEHFVPLLYTLGISDGKEDRRFFNDAYDLGSVSMTGIRFGD